MNINLNVSDEQYADLGNNLIQLLDLKVKPNGRVDTGWGDKTPQGLGRTVARIVGNTLFVSTEDLPDMKSGG